MATAFVPPDEGRGPGPLTGAARKILEVLDCVPGHAEGIALNILAREIGVSPSTGFRLAQLAVRAGFLVQGDDKRYRVGPRLQALAVRALGGFDLRRAARPVLSTLHARCGETVHLSVLECGKVVDVDAIESDHPVKVCSPVGRTLPLHCTSTSKVLLAYRSEQEAVILLQVAGMQRFTERTRTTPAELLPELAAIRERGWALDEEEHERSVVCVAAPVFDAEDSVCAAIGISGLRWNMEAHGLDLLRGLVRGAAGEVSRALGLPARPATPAASG